MGRDVAGTCTVGGLCCLQGTRASRMAFGGWIAAILQINRVWREIKLKLSARNWNVYQGAWTLLPQQRWALRNRQTPKRSSLLDQGA